MVLVYLNKKTGGLVINQLAYILARGIFVDVEKIAVFTFTDVMNSDELATFARRVEQLGCSRI